MAHAGAVEIPCKSTLLFGTHRACGSPDCSAKWPGAPGRNSNYQVSLGQELSRRMLQRDQGQGRKHYCAKLRTSCTAHLNLLKLSAVIPWTVITKGFAKRLLTDDVFADREGPCSANQISPYVRCMLCTREEQHATCRKPVIQIALWHSRTGTKRLAGRGKHGSSGLRKGSCIDDSSACNIRWYALLGKRTSTQRATTVAVERNICAAQHQCHDRFFILDPLRILQVCLVAVAVLQKGLLELLMEPCITINCSLAEKTLRAPPASDPGWVDGIIIK